MRIFTIECSVNGHYYPLDFRVMNTLRPHVFVYNNRKWIGTIGKDLKQNYRLLSGSSQSFSDQEMQCIGRQIDNLTAGL